MATTTLSRMMKKAASSSVFPLANKTIYTSAIFTTPLKNSTTTVRSISTSNITNLSRKVSRAASVSAHHHISSRANKKSTDDALLGVIESKIEDAEEEFDDLEFAEVQRQFPFKIVGNDGEETLTLTRQYHGEEIKVTVRPHDPCSGSDEDEEEESNSQSQYFDLVVSVTKKSGQTLEFQVTAEEDEISIYHMAVMDPNAPDENAAYQGPEFTDLDEDLQKAFEAYLEVRGIEPSIANFLDDYIVSKEQEEHTLWLKKLKNFISN